MSAGRVPAGGLRETSPELNRLYANPYLDCLRKLGLHGELEAVLDQILRRNPDTMDVHERLLDCLLAQERWADLEAAARRATAARSAFPLGPPHLVRALLEQGRPDEAREALEEGLRRYPSSRALKTLAKDPALAGE